MPATQLERDTIKTFVSQSNRAIFITYRKDGGVQSSPMSITCDDDGNILLATRSSAAKVKNVLRDPRAAVCLITEKFLGAWIHLEGSVEVERLPDAFGSLADFYQRRNNEDTSTEEWKQRMLTEDRVLIRVKTDRVVLPPATRALQTAS